MSTQELLPVGVPIQFRLDDERLPRVSLQDVAAWWSQPERDVDV